MAQFARPTSDRATGSWTSTPLWSKIDEGSDGGDTIASDAVANTVATTNADIGLGTVTDPVLSTGHIIRVRWATSSTRDIDPFCELWQGVPGSGTLIATLAPTTILDTTELTDTYTLNATETNNITDYATLYFRLRGTGVGGGPTRSLVVEFAELEVPDATTAVALALGTFTLAGFALDTDISVPLGLGTFTLAGFALGTNISVPLDLGTLTLAGFDLGNITSHIVPLNLGTFTLSGFTLGSNISVPLDLGTFTLSGFAVNVNSLSNSRISAMHFQRHYEPIAMGR